jgi:hypothetical protein
MSHLATKLELSCPSGMRIRVPALLVVLALFANEPIPQAQGQESPPLRVRLDLGPGPYYVGQGIELVVGIVARDQRPAIELPKLRQAEIWTEETSFKPLSATGIGQVQSGSNLYLTHLRLLPHRAGSLEISPIVARLDGRSGRSRARRLLIEAPPLESRPAEFLGGVGGFSVQASADPATVRSGQDFTYRLEISGPAAWGSVSPPDLSRFQRTGLGLRIDPQPVEIVSEPPVRSFVYRIRPTRAGTGVLPPVTVAAFDPRSSRYLTRATQGLPITVVAVSAFDPTSLHYAALEGNRNRRLAAAAARWLAGVLVLFLGLALAVVVRRQRLRAGQSGALGAQRFARRMVRDLGNIPRNGRPQDHDQLIATRAVEGLIEYARIGVGRPSGALTPGDARSVVQCLTGSTDLATQARNLVARCDRVLFSDRRMEEDGRATLEHALGLFAALGRAAVVPIGTLNESPAQETA